MRSQDCPAVTAQAQYGDCPDTRYSEMPGFAAQGTLTEEQIRDVTEHVLMLSGQDAEGAAAARGEAVFSQCTECHGADGRGFKPYGGPDLTDDLWLYGGERGAIAASIAAGRMGRCPSWPTSSTPRRSKRCRSTSGARSGKAKPHVPSLATRTRRELR